MKILNKQPNTTILLPGGCNASCAFCSWDKKMSSVQVPDDYLDRIFSSFADLQPRFNILSISGGEPTLSQYFSKFLSRLSKFRRGYSIERVVLTTNGSMLARFIPAIGCAVDHINISRHALSTESNYEAFGTTSILSDAALQDAIYKIHSETDCDVTLNCVVSDTVTVKFCENFIKYAKELGADAVSFRKEASDVTPTEAELWFRNKYGVVSETKCAVCRGMEQRVRKFPVRWKGTVSEPSLAAGGIYEVIIHPDGNLYADWGMARRLVIEKPGRGISGERNYSRPNYSGCGGGRGGC